MNMVNALLQRIHLSGEIYGWTEKQFALVKEGVECYKRIRSDIPKSIPFYPLGIPKYADGWLCAAYRFDDTIRLGIWRMNTDEDFVEIPFEKKINEFEVLYPFHHKAEIVKTQKGIRLTMPDRFSAILLQLQ